MNKQLYLIILTVVTVVCILFGSCYHIIGWGASFVRKFLPILQDETIGSWEISDSTESDNFQLDDFNSISVDASVMSLTIHPGERASVTYRCSKNLEPHFEVKDGILYIKQEKISRFGNKKCNVTLTVPSGVSYCEIGIDVAVGDIEIENLEGERLGIDANVGDIDLTNLSFADIELDSNVSDVDIENCRFDQLKAESNVGDIDVESTEDLSDYTINLDTSIGSVSCNNRSYRRSYTQKGTSGKSITIDTNTGDIDLEYNANDNWD